MARKPTSGTRHGNGQEHGDGWGGPAKGASKGDAKPFTADTPTRQTIPNGRGDPAKMAARRSQKELDAERAQLLKDHLFTLATKAESEMVQKSASEAWLNRHEGMPIARNVNLNVDDVRGLSDEAIAAELASLGGTGVDPETGDAAAAVPGRSAGMVH